MAYFKCKLNKPALSYKCGETIRFSIYARNKCKNIDCDYIRWTLKTDDGKQSSGFGSCKADSPLVVETSLERPGFAYLNCTAYSESNDPTGAFDVLEAGAGADVENILYHDTLPDDFDEYWNDIEKLIANTEIELLQFKEMSDAKKRFNAYHVMVKTPEGRPSAFTLTVPQADGKYPIKLCFMGYGVRPAPVNYFENTITASFDAHGMDTTHSGIEVAENYPDIYSGYGFSDADNDSKEKTYYRGMMIRDLMGLKYLKTLDKWDGKNIISYGGSQGALQAVTVAAHDSSVSFLDVWIPWFCDLSARSQGYISGWRPNFKEGLRYFDTAAQGMRVKCPTRIFAGLGDTICPPASVMALYNGIKAQKSIQFTQARTHSYEPNELDTYLLSSYDSEIKKGKYRHFKGNEYEVIDIGYDSENESELVIYKALYGDGKIWVRPIEEFRDFVYRDNKVMKRFEYIG